jgi:DNA-binding transcriptional LysR family regulator
MHADLVESLPNLVLFVAVARARSFSGAAKSLGMPVSTVSRRVAEFEARLTLQLLVRTTRRVELTEVGARYFERAEAVVEAADRANDELRGHREDAAGPLRVSATADFASTFLTPLFAQFAQRFPAISFELDLSPRSVDLVAERFDVAVRMGPLPDSPLFARKLGVSPIGLYASPGYLAGAPALRRPADLAVHDCLRLHGAQGRPSTWSFSRGRQLETVIVTGRFAVNSMRFLLELATRGFGVVAIDDFIAHAAVEQGALRRVLPEWSPPPVAVHALTPSRLVPARTRVLLECLAEHLHAETPLTSTSRRSRRG